MFLRTDRQGIIQETSSNFRSIMRAQETFVGQRIQELIFPGGQQGGSGDFAAFRNHTFPCMARIPILGKSCRLIMVPQEETLVFFGELYADSSGEGMAELGALMGQVQSLLERVKKQEDQLRRDLQAAALIQKRFLPQRNTCGPLTWAWFFEPWEHIGGDMFSVFSLNERFIAAYILDVAGHGVPAALVGAAVAHFLHTDSAAIAITTTGCTAPELVLKRLEEDFPLERYNLHFSMVFLIIDLETGRIKGLNAGHPPPIHCSDGTVQEVGAGGPFIGLGAMTDIDEQDSFSLALAPGDRLVLYSDGFPERRSPDGSFFGQPRLIEAISATRNRSLAKAVDHVVTQARQFALDGRPDDDQSLLILEWQGEKPAAEKEPTGVAPG